MGYNKTQATITCAFWRCDCGDVSPNLRPAVNPSVCTKPRIVSDRWKGEVLCGSTTETMAHWDHVHAGCEEGKRTTWRGSKQTSFAVTNKQNLKWNLNIWERGREGREWVLEEWMDAQKNVKANVEKDVSFWFMSPCVSRMRALGFKGQRRRRHLFIPVTWLWLLAAFPPRGNQWLTEREDQIQKTDKYWMYERCPVCCQLAH